MKHKKICFT